MGKSLRFRSFLPFAALITTLSADAQNVGISTDGAAPDLKSILDLNVNALASKRGMLIPRMTMQQRLDLGATLTGTDAGLWVYQTDDPAAAAYDPTNVHGFFYYDATTSSWKRLAAGRSGWGLAGNSNINPATHYLGPSPASPLIGKDFILRSVNPQTAAPQLFIQGQAVNGFTGLNNATPVERLDVGGAIRVGSTVAAPGTDDEGTIVYNAGGATPAYAWHYGNVTGTAAGWKRMENAEVLVPATPNNYPQETMTCPVTPVSGSVTTGTLSGTSTAHPFHTTFTGEPPYGNRACRMQYIYRAAELTAAGLCPGPITAISFNATTSENPAAQMSCKVRMGNTAINGFNAATFWDDAVQTSTPVYNGGVLVATGPVLLTFTTPFNWTGGNLIIELSWIRSFAAQGNSPAIEMETLAAYNPTKYYNVTNNTVPANGDLIDDANTTPPAVTNQPAASFTLATQRPITTFTGSVKSTTYVNGSAPYILYSGALMVDSASNPADTWAATNFRGPGTIRARLGAYDGTTRLSDHVFDRYYDGTVKPEDEGSAQQYDYISLPDLRDYLKNERHLPNMPSRADWEERGTRSLGELQTGLWETVETQALHIIELERDLSTLEALAFGKDLDAARLATLTDEVKASSRLSEQQKLHLIDALRQRAGQQTPGK